MLLIVGEIIMNAEVEISDERSVQVYRGQELLANNSVYIPGEVLIVDISDKTGQYIFEQHNSDFLSGGCEGKRFLGSAKKQTKLIAPAEHSEDVDYTAPVTVIVAWAMSHETVKITRPFILQPSETAKLKPKKTETEGTGTIGIELLSLPFSLISLITRGKDSSFFVFIKLN